MEFRKIKNKDGQVLTTKDGIELEELRLEAGDEFIPLFNSVLERVNKDVEVTKNGKTTKQNITNYSIKCKARDINKQPILHNGEEDIFVTLTPAQAKSLKKKVDEGVELNQNVFVAYTYDSEDYGEQIGVGLKKANKPPISFDEIDQENDKEE